MPLLTPLGLGSVFPEALQCAQCNVYNSQGEEEDHDDNIRAAAHGYPDRRYANLGSLGPTDHQIALANQEDDEDEEQDEDDEDLGSKPIGSWVWGRRSRREFTNNDFDTEEVWEDDEDWDLEYSGKILNKLNKLF